jgi:2Fe-2S ferredoxin
MGTIFVTDRDGLEHEIIAQEGENLMEILRDGGLPIEGICGGVCVCSTCHVYMAQDWMTKSGTRDYDEQVMVEDSGSFQETSRLACQIEYTPELEGMRLTLAPEF